MEAFTFSPPEPLNCTIIDSSGRSLYTIRPPNNLMGVPNLSSRVVNKISESNVEECIAEVSHHTLFKNSFKFMGEDIKGLKWQDGRRTMQFVAPWDSKTYSWSISDDGKEFKLRENSESSVLAPQEIAIFQQGKRTELSDSLKPTLFILPERRVLDGVIATFVYFSKMLREQAKKSPVKIGERIVKGFTLPGAQYTAAGLSDSSMAEYSMPETKK
ncbi:hypothetical protein VKT23_016874 [Stygiomarasmius scandens]|uniref:DUF6593 domain-containing protein n=1 Tax=Marasmiellus scandens TaxID=2682957 RepID=A0ABR1ITV0_9AGAR